MRRSRTTLTLLVLAAVALSGCGRSDDTDKPRTADPVGSGPATGTITMWAQGAEAEKLPVLLAEFKKRNPDVTVNVTPIPWSAAHDKYQTAIAGGTTPDIGQLGSTWMGEFGATKALAPTPTDLRTDAFYPGAAASTQVGGGTFGVPWYVDTPVLYYRTDLARQAGFDKPPATWADFKALAKAFKEKAGAKFGVSLPPKDFQAFLPFAWSNGAGLTTGDGSKWTLDTPEMVEALRYYQSFFTEGLADRSPSTDAGAQEAAFVNGSVPMLITGPYEVAALLKAGGADFAGKFATAVLPKGRTSTSFVGGSNLVVFDKSKNASAAWKLIRFLSEPATQVTWYKATGDLPSVQSAWSDPALRDDPKLKVFGEQLTRTQAPPATTEWTQVQDAANTQFERLTVTGADPTAVAKAIQSSAAAIGTGR